jgi:hypothetical protein
MRGMLVHVGLSRVLVGPCWWTVLGGVVSVVYFWVGIGKIALPVCSLTRMTTDTMLVLDFRRDNCALLKIVTLHVCCQTNSSYHRDKLTSDTCNMYTSPR